MGFYSVSSVRRKQGRLAESALKRARALADVDTRNPAVTPPPGAVLADPARLAHNNTYSPLPRFYVDRVIKCRECGAEEVWLAGRQKWWYEVAKGSIWTDALYCRSCRTVQKTVKAAARKVHLEGLARKRKPAR